jgi:hypothetical protein
MPILNVYQEDENIRLSVSQSVLFNFFLLSDSSGSIVVLRSQHEFIGEAFSEGLDGSQSLLSGSQTDLGDTNGNSSEWRNIDRLSLGGTTTSDSGTVFSWTSVGNSVDHNLYLVSFMIWQLMSAFLEGFRISKIVFVEKDDTLGINKFIKALIIMRMYSLTAIFIS